MERLKSKKIQVNYFYIIVLIFAIAIRLIYLSYTDFHTRSYDAEAHVQYINYVLNNHHIPSPTQCWECWQPPLYYLSSAGFIQIAALGQTTNINIRLQYFSLGLDLICILFAILIFKHLIKKKHLQYLAIILFAFWPSHIIHSIRIGNDILFYTFTIISLYYLLKWNTNPSKLILLAISLVCAAFSLLTKTNGVIMIAVILINYIYYQLLKVRRVTLLLSIILSLTFLISTLFILQKNNINFIHNSKNLNEGLRISNNLQSYIGFNLGEFIQRPFTSPGDDIGGRQFFFMYLAKTSLFGEFQFGNTLQIISAFNIQLLFVVCMLFAFIGSVHYQKKTISLYLFSAVSLLSMILFRFKYPFACSNDFRYIFPTLIPFLFFYIQSIDYFEKKSHHFIASMIFACGIVFLLLSILFFLLPLPLFKSLSGV